MHHAWLLAGPRGHRQGDARLSLARARAGAAGRARSRRAEPEVAARHVGRAAGARAVASGPAGAAPALRHEGEALRAPASPSTRCGGCKSFLGLTRGRGRLARGHRRRGRRAQRQRRQRAAEVAGGAAARARCSCWSRRQPSRLLPTIRSRCRRLDLAAAGGRGVARGAATRRWRPPTWRCRPPQRLAAARAARRGQRAAARCSWRAAAGIELHERIEALLAACRRSTGRPCIRLPTSSRSPRTSSASRLFFDLLLDLLARLVRARATGEGGAEERGAGRPADPARRDCRPGPPCGRESCARRPIRGALNLDRKA